MFRKRSKVHQHILYILQNIECRDLIAFFIGGGGGGHLRGLRFVEAIYPFLLEKKIRIQNSVERILVTVIQILSWKRIQLSDLYVS